MAIRTYRFVILSTLVVILQHTIVSSGDLNLNGNEVDFGPKKTFRLLDDDKFEIRARMENGLSFGCQGKKTQDYEEIVELFLEDDNGRREPAPVDISSPMYRSQVGSEELDLSLKWWPRECLEKLAGFYRDDFGCNCLPGTDGLRGPPGPDGPPGPPGPDGKDGGGGSNGANGINGTPGANGNPGAKGPVGPPGNPGLCGNPGLPGLKGLSGRPGRPGQTGQTGTAGKPGTPGKRGSDGLPGKAGAPGPQGAEGLPGLQGIPGSSGINGLNPASGRPGIPGIPGNNGIPGANAECPPSVLGGWVSSAPHVDADVSVPVHADVPVKSRSDHQITILKGSSWNTNIALDNETYGNALHNKARVDLDYSDESLSL